NPVAAMKRFTQAKQFYLAGQQGDELVNRGVESLGRIGRERDGFPFYPFIERRMFGSCEKHAFSRSNGRFSSAPTPCPAFGTRRVRHVTGRILGGPNRHLDSRPQGR